MDLNGKYATWKGLVGTALVCIGLVGTFVGWAWSIHTSRPHSGVATEQQLQLLEEELSRELNAAIGRIDRKLDTLLSRTLP